MNGRKKMTNEWENTLKIKLQNTVVGRSVELGVIEGQFECVLNGASSLAAISGGIGIGKTALIKAAMNTLTSRGATCVYCKFEQYEREAPYAGMIQILEQLTNHILTQPQERLDEAKKNLLESLGKDGGLITSIAPQTARILGPMKTPKISDYKKLKIRLRKTFQIFLSIVGTSLQPLAVFIDDMQWADTASWSMMRSMDENSTMLLVLAFRNNTSVYLKKREILLKTFEHRENYVSINLSDIDQTHIRTLLNTIFEGKFVKINEAALFIYRRTLGHPLYVRQLIHTLFLTDFLRYEAAERQWQLNLDSIETLDLPDDFDSLTRSKINALSQEEKTIIEVLTCTGSRYFSSLVASVSKIHMDTIKKSLLALCDTGLLVHTAETSKGIKSEWFEISHDRIGQLVYEQIDGLRKERLHFDIAMEMLNSKDKAYLEETLLYSTAHLLKAPHQIAQYPDRESIIEHLYAAGLKARRTAAVEYALKLFKCCVSLLEEEAWKRQYDQTFRIKLALAECEFVCGYYETSSAIFEEMLAYVTKTSEIIAVKKQYMILNSYTGTYENVIELGIQTLGHLGLTINRKGTTFQTVMEVLRGKWLFRRTRLGALESAANVANPQVIETLEILNIMAPAANITDEDLFALIVLKISNLSAAHGKSIYAALGYAAYSLVLCNVLKEYEKSAEIESIALNLTETIEDDAINCVTYFIIGTFIHHWWAPAQASFVYLKKSFEASLVSGEFFYGGFTITSMIEMKFFMGEPLTEIKKFLVMHQQYGQKMNHDILLRLIRIFSEHIAVLSGKQDGELMANEIGDLQTNEIMTYYILKQQRLYLKGDIEGAYEVAALAIEQIDIISGYILQVDCIFYFLLLNLELEKRGSHRRHPKFKKYRRQLEKWSALNPDNNRARHLLVEALWQQIHGSKEQSALCFEGAIKHAVDQNHILLEALGHALAASFYLYNPKLPLFI